MKALKILILVLAVCAFAVPAAAQHLDTFGYYTIVRPPKAFADISEIHLAGDYGAQQNPPFYGLIRFKKKSAKDNRLLKPALKGRNISFTTRTVGGVYYKFSGTFTKLFDKILENAGGPSLQGTALTGTLIKYKGKKKIAGAYLRFTYFAGD